MSQPKLHRGKLARVPKVLAVRPLTREDLAVLRETRVQPRVKALRAQHHRIAYMIAAKMTTAEIVDATGYSITRILQLRADPSVQQLAAEMEPDATEQARKAVDEFQRLKLEHAMMAEELIGEHLYRAIETGDLPSIKTLLPISQDYADRFGYGKHSTQTSEVKDYAKALELAMARDGRGAVIDAKVVPAHPAPSPEVDAIQPPPSPGSQSVAATSAGKRRV